MNTMLHILPDGTVYGFYTEAINLTALGTLRVERASTIEFDNLNQVWRVFDRRGRCLHSSPSRADCVRWESEHLNNKEDARNTSEN